MIGVVALQPV
jgi:hypothetical protein